MNQLFRLDAKTGAQLANSSYNGFVGTPLIQGDTVFAGASFSNLYTMTTNLTGPRPFSGGATHGTYSQITMTDSTTVVSIGVRSLQAFDVVKMAFTWSYPLTQYNNGNPAAGMAQLGDLLFVPNNKEFLALNVTIPGGPTGFTWWYLTQTPIVAAPEVNPHDGLVYVPESGTFNPTLWALNAATGAVAWGFNGNNGRLGCLYGTPLYHNGRVYFGTDYYGYNTPNFYALDAKTGLVLWSFSAESNIRSKPVVSGNSIIFITSSGTVHSLRM